MNSIPVSTVATVQQARLDLAQALVAVLEATFCAQWGALGPDVKEIMADMDDHLTKALSCLRRAGLYQPELCEQELHAAATDLRQLLSTLPDHRSSQMTRRLLVHASYLVSRVQTTLPHLVIIHGAPPAPPAVTPGKISIPYEGILTVRERQVIKLIARGLTYRQVASRLKLSFCTVRTHNEHILKKLRCHRMTQAVAMYVAAESEEFD